MLFIIIYKEWFKSKINEIKFFIYLFLNKLKKNLSGRLV